METQLHAFRRVRLELTERIRPFVLIQLKQRKEHRKA